MGFQTNISILNDTFDCIEKDPEMFVEAIKFGMHNGTESLVTEFYDAQRPKPRTRYEEARWADINYVTVHPTQHADVPQVIYTHQNSAYSVYDFARGVELGVLDLKSNADTYCKIGREMAKELRRQAKYLDAAIKAYETKDKEQA